MKKLSLLVALIMAITIFWIPGQSVFAIENEGDSEAVVEAQEQGDKWTVTFDSDGGTVIDPQIVVEGDKATKPADPTKPADANYTYKFENWYEGESTTPYDFNTPVMGDITLKAKWTPTAIVPTFNLGSVSVNQTAATFNWSWTSGTGTVVIQLYRSAIKDRTSSYSYNQKITNAYTFSGLSDGTEYNYIITATPNGGSAETYTGSITTAAKKYSGWYTEGTNKYYYIKGVKQRETEVKLSADSSQLYHYFDCNGVFKGRRDYMYSRIKGLSSKTYLICVDRTNNVVCVYKGGKNKWYPYKYWSCVTGRMKKGDYHPTPLGTYKVKSRKMTFSGYGIPEKKKNRYSVWYCTRFVGSVFFHSQLYKYKSKSSFIPGGAAMGRNASHGCIRLHKANAAWVYKNCKKGTTVVVIQ